jgi:periplasmic protein TonB
MSVTLPGNNIARDRLLTMLLLVALLHAILLLGLTFSAGVGRQLSEGLEVLLTTEDLPDAATNPDASYLAQRTQKGAGNSAKGLTSSPDQARDPGAEAAEAADASEGAVLHSAAPQPLISFIGIEASPTPSHLARQTSAANSGDAGRGVGDELVLRGDPDTGKWLSPNTRAYRLAPYLDSWRRKVERLGTINYPSVAKRAQSAQAPVIEVALLASGKLQGARVLQSSGDAALDQSALDILRLASPFPALPAALARDYRVLRFAYQWEFMAGTLSSGSVTANTEAASKP